MDLTGNDRIVTNWSYNVDNGVYTVAFNKVVGITEVTLGNILLEKDKFRSMINALDEISRALMPDIEPHRKHRTSYNTQAGKGITDFNP
jgi:hypothetical protein